MLPLPLLLLVLVLLMRLSSPLGTSKHHRTKRAREIATFFTCVYAINQSAWWRFFLRSLARLRQGYCTDFVINLITDLCVFTHFIAFHEMKTDNDTLYCLHTSRSS